MSQHIYTRSELILIHKIMERTEAIESRIPGTAMWLLIGLTMTFVPIVIYMTTYAIDYLWIVSVIGSFLAFRFAVKLWVIARQLGNIRALPPFDLDLEPVQLAGDDEPANAINKVSKTQIRRPNFARADVSAREWRLICAAVAANNWRISRPLLESDPYNIEGLKTYIHGKTRYRWILDELEKAGMLNGGGMVPEEARAAFTAPPPDLTA